MSVSIRPAERAIPLPATTFPVSVELRSSESRAVRGRVRLVLPAGWRAAPRQVAFTLPLPNEIQQVSFQVMPDPVEQRRYTLAAVAETTTGTTREGFRSVTYPGLIPTNLYAPATDTVSMVEVKVAPGLKVGYLAGTGDPVQKSLEDLGVHVTPLTIEDVIRGRLGGYDVVVLGVQAYAAHPELAAANGKLLAYAKNGGVLIVQYNRGSFDYGPYPLSLGIGEKMVEETAPVKLLRPQSAVLNWPNRITEKGFNGWVEERGHGFMASWDRHYEALLETHDAGQKPQQGGLLVTRTRDIRLRRAGPLPATAAGCAGGVPRACESAECGKGTGREIRGTRTPRHSARSRP